MSLRALVVVGVALALAPAAGARDAVSDCAAAAPVLSDGGEASEYWDLTARLEPGLTLLQRFVVTNVGPGERTAAAIGSLLVPNEPAQHWENGRRQGRWSLVDGVRLEVGKSALDLGSPHEVRLLLSKKSIRLDLRIACDRAATTAAPTPEIGPAGYRVGMVAISSPVEGTLWRPGMTGPVPVRGRAALSHTLAENEATSLQQRIEFHALGDGATWSLVGLEPPGGRGRGGGWRRLFVRPEGATLEVTDRVGLVATGALQDWGQPRYPIASRLELESNSLRGSVELERPVLQRDPLSLLPQPFRFWVGLRMDPLRVWAASRFAVTLPPGSPGRGESEPGRRRGVEVPDPAAPPGGRPDDPADARTETSDGPDVATGNRVQHSPAAADASTGAAGAPASDPASAVWMGAGLVALSFTHPATPPGRAKPTQSERAETVARSGASERP